MKKSELRQIIREELQILLERPSSFHWKAMTSDYSLKDKIVKVLKDVGIKYKDKSKDKEEFRIEFFSPRDMDDAYEALRNAKLTGKMDMKI